MKAMFNPAVAENQHEYDEDGCCVKCGFDGAEWHWWRYHTYEGKAHPEAKPPLCKFEWGQE